MEGGIDSLFHITFQASVNGKANLNGKNTRNISNHQIINNFKTTSIKAISS